MNRGYPSGRWQRRAQAGRVRSIVFAPCHPMSSSSSETSAATTPLKRIVVDASVAMMGPERNAELDGLLNPACIDKLPREVVFRMKTLGDVRKLSPLPAYAVSEYASNNGFIAAFMLAYNHHLPLRLSPDVVWLTIVQSVGVFLHDNAETYRDVFVGHDKGGGKVELCVVVPESWDEDESLVEWDDVMGALNDMITTNTKVHVSELFRPDFSTTTLPATTACNITTMAAMSSYFAYSMRTRCGLGEVVMDGTVEDWHKLRARAAALRSGLDRASVQLAPWLDRLDVVLAALASTAAGSPDTTFWSHAYSSHVVRGSGGGTFVSGWLLDFYFAGRAKRPDTVMLDELPRGYVDVPFTWKHASGAYETLTLLAGTWSAYVDGDGVVAAIPQWAVANNKAEEPPARVARVVEKPYVAPPRRYVPIAGWD